MMPMRARCRSTYIQSERFCNAARPLTGHDSVDPASDRALRIDSRVGTTPVCKLSVPLLHSASVVLFVDAHIIERSCACRMTGVPRGENASTSIWSP
ncbi:hypothetical protein LMG28138_02947 [Pararobbsia alpina]|uniref:Uncharacterized protein n=1 Tax=Pararobbsia alpina TaxID=621374 RepID=A0A6S7CHM4_9BURK|nr:hypothetical protein LMG28138_02947 [Pararobbsia alpina]